MKQKKIYVVDDYGKLDEHFADGSIGSALLVCDSSFQFLKIKGYFDTVRQRPGIKVVKFDNFQPNPLYESVVEGVDLFRREKLDSIIAIGGGSAIDVAKCIKLYSNMEGGGSDGSYLRQKIESNNVRLFVVPTTAGTGSEATRYAVIYYKGEKQTITHESMIPGTVLFDPSVLKTLSLYQKKVTMADAFCHGIESFWSVNSTDESRKYSKKAIKIIIDNMDGYLANDEKTNARMQKAAYIAGKAINIAQTTAGHAMCYKLTGLYGIAHGHAAALCVRRLWPWMVENTDRCIDPRGQGYLQYVFDELADAMGCGSRKEAAEKFGELITGLELDMPSAAENEFEVLTHSVNPVRLKNHPVMLDEELINSFYHDILRMKSEN